MEYMNQYGEIIRDPKEYMEMELKKILAEIEVQEGKKIDPNFAEELKIRISELTNGLEPIQPQKVEEDKKQKPWELSEEEANKINPEKARETAEAKSRENNSKQLPDNIIE